MRHLILPTLALGLASLGAPAGAQSAEKLYYKFEAGGLVRALNYAADNTPNEGKVVTTNSQAWVTGKFGRFAMGGRESGKSIYADTAWNGALSGDVSISWFMKARSSHGTSPSYFFSGVNAFRCFTGGAAGKGLRLAGWGGPDVTLNTDIQALAASGWVHVAILIASGNNVQWFVNGNQVQIDPITANLSVSAGANPFRIGAHTDLSATTAYDIDEFRVVESWVGPATVAAWNNDSSAAHTVYGKPCGASISPFNSLPKLGNTSYGIDLVAPPGAICCFGFGSNMIKFMGADIPFDIGNLVSAGAGCFIENSIDIEEILGTVPPSGRGGLRVPIPNNAFLKDLTFYIQGIYIDVNLKITAANGIAISIGR